MSETNHKREHPAQTVLEPIMHALCSHKDEFCIHPVDAGGVTILGIDCDDRDCGKIAGRRGTLINSFFIVARQIGMKHKMPVRLEPKMAQTRDKDPRSNMQIDPNYDSEAVRVRVQKICELAFRLPGVTTQKLDMGTSTSISIEPHAMEKVDPEFIQALNRIFWSYGRATGRPRISVNCRGVQYEPDRT